MTFLAPIWLLGLLPWGMVTVWLLLGRRRRQPVPFLPLWRGPVHPHRVLQAPERPPLSLVMALAALLLAILAAAGPRLPKQRGGDEQTLTIVVDCGATMSATTAEEARFVQVAKRVQEPLLQALGSGPVELIDVPRAGRRRTDRDHWFDQVKQLQPTGLETRGPLRATVASLLAGPGGLVVVLSDQHLELNDPRLVQIAPASDLNHVGLVRIAAREGEASQVMVTVRNESDQTAATLSVRSASPTTMPISLPARGMEQNYFVPLQLGDVVEAELSGPDDLMVDHHAWMVRERSFPRLETRFALQEKLERMVEVYQKQRPPHDASRRVVIVREFADLPSGEAGIALSEPAATTTAPSGQAEVTLMPHPITGSLHASDFAGTRISDRAPTAAGWQTVIAMGGRPAVMVRADPRPQVWVGFDGPEWGSTPAFVIFWTNIFDWVGGQAETFASYPLTSWQPEWQPRDPNELPGPAGLWPGIYRGPGGELRAFNTLNLHPQVKAVPAAWQEQLRLLDLPAVRGFALAPALLLASLAAMLLAVLSWRRRSPSSPGGAGFPAQTL